MPNECRITTSKRLYWLISNGLSASGILPIDILGVCLVPFFFAVHQQRKKPRSCCWDFNISLNTVTAITSPFFFFLNFFLILYLLLFLYCLLRRWHCQCSLMLRLHCHPLKGNMNTNKNSCSEGLCPLLHTLPQPMRLCGIQTGLSESSYSITNRPPTGPLTTLTFFLQTEKMDRLNVLTQVIIRPHLFNEIRLSAPGKELRKQNASTPPLI